MVVAEGPLSSLTIRSLKTSDDWLFLSDVFFRNSITTSLRCLGMSRSMGPSGVVEAVRYGAWRSFF